MKNIKAYILLSLSVAFVILCIIGIIMLGINADKRYKDYSFQNIQPVFVEKVPEGYIPLKSIEEEYADILTIGFFESVIYIQNVDGVTIKQTSLSDENFLVQYKDDIYINEVEFKKVVPSAQKTAIAKNKIYNIDENIEIYNGQKEPAFVNIGNVFYTENYENTIIKNNEWICVVELTVQGNNKDFNSTWEYFELAETYDGQQYKTVIENDTDEMAFILPKEMKVKYLYIKSPSYLNCIRKIKL